MVSLYDHRLLQARKWCSFSFLDDTTYFQTNMKMYICDISIDSRPDAPTTQGLYPKPFILRTQGFIPLPSLSNPILYNQTLRRLAP